MSNFDSYVRAARAYRASRGWGSGRYDGQRVSASAQHDVGRQRRAVMVDSILSRAGLKFEAHYLGEFDEESIGRRKPWKHDAYAVTIGRAGVRAEYSGRYCTGVARRATRGDNGLTAAEFLAKMVAGMDLVDRGRTVLGYCAYCGYQSIEDLAPAREQFEEYQLYKAALHRMFPGPLLDELREVLEGD